MKRHIIIIITVITLGSLVSCKKFLKENPKSFLTTGEFYKTQPQIEAAVNGCYAGLIKPWSSTFVGLPISPVLSIAYLTGYTRRIAIGGTSINEANFLNISNPIPNTNSYLDILWKGIYYSIENCNSVIEHVSTTNVIGNTKKNEYLGQVYFLRAWYYFLGVRLFGSIPLKTTPTKGLTNLKIPRDSIVDIYNQIVMDLTKAAGCGLPWADISGRVTEGAIKSLLAKVYLTMAGYPLKKGNEYYKKSYDIANEVIGNGSYSLFPAYADIRNPADANTGGNIFMIQCDPTIAINLMSYATLPFNYPVANLYNVGGGLVPDTEFINSYTSDDRRLKDFFYIKHANYKDQTDTITLPQPYLLKYWDNSGATTGKYGNNIPLIRYADVLLTCAEAKAMLSGGTTSDPTAINAYYQVLHRAFPNKPKPSSITFNQIFKERCRELCYENKTWFAMIRTRKAFDVVNNEVVNLIGYQAPTHKSAFKKSELLLPIPYNEIQLDPLLKK